MIREILLTIVAIILVIGSTRVNDLTSCLWLLGSAVISLIGILIISKK